MDLGVDVKGAFLVFLEPVRAATIPSGRKYVHRCLGFGPGNLQNFRDTDKDVFRERSLRCTIRSELET